MRSKFILSLIALLIFCSLLSLGVWQLHRAVEKRLLLNNFSKRAHMPYLEIKDLDKPRQVISALRYFPIKAQGYYDNNHVFLLDNKFYQHHLGYEVLTLFFPQGSNKPILVNRGWIPRSPSGQQQLPNIPQAPYQQTIHGTLYVPLGKPFVLKQMPILSRPHWPIVVQALQIERFAMQLKQDTYPALIWLDKQEANGFIRDWQPVFMSPQQHCAYAFQWFALALTLLIIYIILSKKKK